MSFEDDLRLALRREQAPPDFAARVMASAEGQTRIHALRPSRSAYKAWAAMAAGIALMVLVPAAVDRQQEQERQAREGVLAEKQLVRALRLTGRQLKMTQSLLREMSER
jgi:hypothetical protein